MGKRKDKTRSCEKCRHLESGTHVPDDRIRQREGVEISVSGLAKNVAGHQGLQLQKVVGPDEKL